MKTIELNGKWKMKNVKWGEWLEAEVPGTVFSDLLKAGRAPDPYDRDNEEKVAPLFREDYLYHREFDINSEILSHDKVELCCEGLDTLSEITVNCKKLAETDNMHRTYRFDIKPLLKAGHNTIEILFRSPVTYLESKDTGKNQVISIIGKGIEKIRKAQCMFGWDWGLSLPDSGIWRDIYIECFDAGRIKDLQILQHHGQNEVTLELTTKLECFSSQALEVKAEVLAPDGHRFTVNGSGNPQSGSWQGMVTITDPQLWWPNNFGRQPLYQVAVSVAAGGKVCDQRNYTIGLRTIELRREPDQWGTSYEFVVNGRALFIKGSNLIIEDAILSRYSKKKTEKMIKSCVDANFNCIRVWGGSVYPDDYFYDLCDRYGIILYHDLMFACNFYPTDQHFMDSIKAEISDNVSRVRHHASIGLWSGNNEIEVVFGICTSPEPSIVEMRKAVGISEMDVATKEKLLVDFTKIFCDEIPLWLKSLDPQTSYVRSSPTARQVGEVSLFNNADHGDAHYYLAYDNLAPYTKMRSLYFRFVSEMGFQSYPDMKTIKAFTLPEDRQPYSEVMLKHQKCINGNQTIEAYMVQDYRVPKDFGKYVYVSQMLAGEVLRYSVEHLRRNEGRCMGVLTWQLNDCWPVVSWAGLDYFGRWKAQQYYSKRFYAPVLISACDDGAKIDLWVTNDTPEDLEGKVVWKLLNSRSELIEQGEKDACVISCSSTLAVALDFSKKIDEKNRGEYYLEFTFESGSKALSKGMALFVKPKDFNFSNPKISCKVTDDGSRFTLSVKSVAFAKSVFLELTDTDCIFSDNYFDLSAGKELKITVEKSSLSDDLTPEQFLEQLRIISVYDID